jgi:hypothetical protein
MLLSRGEEVRFGHQDGSARSRELDRGVFRHGVCAKGYVYWDASLRSVRIVAEQNVTIQRNPAVRADGGPYAWILLGRAAREGLSQSALPHQLRPRDRSTAPSHLRLDLRHPSSCVLWNTRHPSDCVDQPRRPMGTCRDWSDPGRPSHCCGMAVGRCSRLSPFASKSSHATEPDRDGMSDAPSSGVIARDGVTLRARALCCSSSSIRLR